MSHAGVPSRPPSSCSAARTRSTATERIWPTIWVVSSDGSRSWIPSAVRAARSATSRRSAAALGVLVVGGEDPHRVGQLAHGARELRGGLAVADLARGVAGQHARVAHRGVELRHRGLVAADEVQPAASLRREARRLDRGRDRLLEQRRRRRRCPRAACSAASARAGSAASSARGGVLERPAELAEQRLARPGRPSPPGRAAARATRPRGRRRRRSGPRGCGRRRSRTSPARTRRSGSRRSRPR